MEPISFTYFVGENSSDLEWLICATSIRAFGGRFATAPIYIFTPTSNQKISSKVIHEIRSLQLKLIEYNPIQGIPENIFGNFVYAALKAEEYCRNKTQLMVWLGGNTFILNEPKAFQIPSKKSIGYCPVHHTNIGSILSQPIDEFWKRIYVLCEVNEKKIFPMQTQMDENVLRPYFNAGSLVIRPENHLFQKWWLKFRKFMTDPVLNSFFQSNVKYKIFYHQAILSGIILEEYPRNTLEQLPFEYNYPLNLHENAPIQRKIQKLGELITTRFEEIKDIDLITSMKPYANLIAKLSQ